MWMVGGVCTGLFMNAYAVESIGLTAALQNVRNACSGISESMSGMKTMAGINTAVTGVGTVTGGVALGASLAKASLDREIEELEEKIKQLDTQRGDIQIEELEIEDSTKYEQDINTVINEYRGAEEVLADAEKKSKTLGNIRTGTMAASAVLDTAGTIIALNNRTDESLKQRVGECVTAVNVLHDERMRARAENTASEIDLVAAEKIVKECSDWANVDLSSIDDRATGAAISGGAGAVMGIAGTITSASANSDSVRSNNSEEGKAKEENLNTASTVLAGGTTVASAVATVFNATQISAIKKAVAAADKCEGALR